MYRPNIQQFTTPIRVQHRVETLVNGAPDISWEDASPAIQYCNFKPFHGTEAVQAGSIGTVDGGTITMWYDPSLKTSDRILLNDNINLAYEVLNPENVEMRNQFLILKVFRVVNS
jgi:hypothetical protein